MKKSSSFFNVTSAINPYRFFIFYPIATFFCQTPTQVLYAKNLNYYLVIESQINQKQFLQEKHWYIVSICASDPKLFWHGNEAIG